MFEKFLTDHRKNKRARHFKIQQKGSAEVLFVPNIDKSVMVICMLCSSDAVESLLKNNSWGIKSISNKNDLQSVLKLKIVLSFQSV